MSKPTYVCLIANSNGLETIRNEAALTKPPFVINKYILDNHPYEYMYDYWGTLFVHNVYVTFKSEQAAKTYAKSHGAHFHKKHYYGRYNAETPYFIYVGASEKGGLK